MNIFTKLLGALTGGVFIAFLFFAFLGADSVERPVTLPLMRAGEICLAASLILFLIRFICLRRQRGHTDV
jgi:hypothetical protein